VGRTGEGRGERASAGPLLPLCMSTVTDVGVTFRGGVVADS